MSPLDYRQQRMAVAEARKLISRLAKAGALTISRHGAERLLERSLTVADVLNVCLSSDARMLGQGEEKDGRWAYAIATRRIKVVVGFNRDGTDMTLVSAMRRDNEG
jgi:hypothetical protein